MKLRTSLAAAATATAVMVSGAAVADATPTVNDTAESKSKDSGDKKTIKDSLSSSNEEGSSIEDMTPEELKSWIAVVTAIIGMLTQVLSIASKFAR